MAHPSESSVVARIGLALGISALAGVLVAGLALPVVGGVGLAAKSASDDFLSLPATLNTPDLATRSRVLDQDGNLLATFYSTDRVATKVDQVPDVMKQAIVAIEDSRFYEHDGVDVKGTIRAAVTNAQSGRVAQGGSTLTQQYVKNALIEAATTKEEARAAREDSADRKLREARYALQLEQTLPKEEILHRYLDIAYFGNQIYGVGTAANYYFKKSVQNLSLTESAELAGMVQNPNRFNPMSEDPEVRQGVKDRRNTVLARMRDLGDIDQATYATAVKAGLPQVTPTKVASNCEAAGVTAPFFCDYVRRELTETEVGAALGDTPTARMDRILQGGLTITTSLDPKVQAAAQGAVDERLPRDDSSGAVAATNSVEPGTGLIRAMAVNRAFGSQPGQTSVNFAIGGSYGPQAGSTFKVFTLAAALQQGLPVGTRIYSPETYSSDVFKNGDEPYTLSNADVREAGTFDMRRATADSVNTYFVQLLERTGAEAPNALAESLGVRRVLPTGLAPLERNGSSVLGTNEVSPLAMAGAYAAFDAHGTFCPPRAVTRIDGPGGEVSLPDNGCRQVVEPGVADTVTDLLRGVITEGTARRNGQLGRPAAGKTGTAQESKAVWFIGYTPQLATAVWVGLPTPTPLLRIRVGGQYYRQMFGGDLPTQIWRQTMRGALEGLPEEGFSEADPDVVDGRQLAVPDTEGLSYDEAVLRLEQAGFDPTRGRRVSSQLPQGVVAYTYPAAGDEVDQGATVYVYTSRGRLDDPSAQEQPATAAPAGNDQGTGNGQGQGRR